MYARSRRINLPSGAPLVTPILLPSFSSKGFPELKKIMSHLAEYISGPMLVSAYDVKYSKLAKIPFEPDLLFVDSGGYECSNLMDFVELDKHYLKHEAWDQDIHRATLKKMLCNNRTNKSFISYDHPSHRVNLSTQIKMAKELYKSLVSPVVSGPMFLKEILIKPEAKADSKQYVPVDKIVVDIEQFRCFDIIGFTEKELGRTLMEVMVNICKISKALESHGMMQPIHIFGTLDPISTPLYFMCGADIFDGVTWMRYSFSEGKTIYQQNNWLSPDRLTTEYFTLKLQTFVDNYKCLLGLRAQMLNFERTKKFEEFTYNHELFKRIWTSVETGLGGCYGR
jgi:hypothetical protein